MRKRPQVRDKLTGEDIRRAAEAGMNELCRDGCFGEERARIKSRCLALWVSKRTDAGTCDVLRAIADAEFGRPPFCCSEHRRKFWLNRIGGPLLVFVDRAQLDTRERAAVQRDWASIERTVREFSSALRRAVGREGGSGGLPFPVRIQPVHRAPVGRNGPSRPSGCGGDLPAAGSQHALSGRAGLRGRRARPIPASRGRWRPWSANC